MPKISDSGVELDALAKATPEEQVAAVEAVKTGQAKTIREVISQPKPVYTHGTEKPAPPTPRAKPTVREALAKGRYNKSPELLEWVRTYQRWPTKTKAKARELFLTITPAEYTSMLKEYPAGLQQRSRHPYFRLVRERRASSGAR